MSSMLGKWGPVEYRRQWSDVQRVKEQVAQIGLAKSAVLAVMLPSPVLYLVSSMAARGCFVEPVLRKPF